VNGCLYNYARTWYTVVGTPSGSLTGPRDSGLDDFPFFVVGDFNKDRHPVGANDWASSDRVGHPNLYSDIIADLA